MQSHDADKEGRSQPLDPGHEAYKVICPRTFRIERTCGGTTQIGTGFSVGRLLESNRLLVAKAGHVLGFPDGTEVHWRVQQFDLHGALERQIEFTTKQPESEPCYVRHKKIDIGFVALPEKDNQGKVFTRPSEYGLPVIDDETRIMEGGRVGWAGFAYHVEEYLGRPHLCYFEGSISAFKGDHDAPAYVVDGHNAHGVSGGPVWHWPYGDERIEIVGIVTEYRRRIAAPLSAKPPLPGFCVFVPINPIIVFMKSQYKAATVET